MGGKVIVVKAARDQEAGVWFVESSDVPGLNLEADSLDALADQLPGAILDLLEAGGAVLATMTCVTCHELRQP